MFGLFALVVAYFAWQFSTGGSVPVGWFTSQIESTINAGLKDFQLHLGNAALEWSKDKKFAYLQFDNVEAVDGNGNVIARVPKANLSLSGPALMGRDVVLNRVELVGASALVVHRADGGFQLGLQVGDHKSADNKPDEASPGMVKAMLEAMLTPKANDKLARYLTRFAITDARLTLFDEKTRSYWTAEKASLAFDRKPDGVVVSVDAPVQMRDNSKWLFTAAAHYTNGNPHIALEAAFQPVRLKLLAASGVGLKALEGIDIPVQGNATCDLLLAGELGRCKFWLNAGTGYLKLPALKPDPIHLKSAALTVEMDFPTKRYSIEEMTWQGNTIRGKVTGDGAFAFGADGALQTLTADWTAENISIDAPNVFDGGLALQTLKVKAAFDGVRRHLQIDDIHATKDDFDLSLSGEMQDGPGSTGVILNGGFKNLTVANLKRLWPAGVAEGARGWVLTNAHEGIVRNCTVAVNLAPGAIVDNKIPDEGLNIVMAMEGMRFTYLDGLPDMTNVRGVATTLGDTFKAELSAGTIGRLSLSAGNVLIPTLHQHGTIGTFAGTIAGPTLDLLTLLDRPRLGYPTRYGLKAAQSGGTSDVRFSFTIPMLQDVKEDDIGINVDGDFKDVKIPINEQLRLTGGVFNMKLDNKGMKAHGAVQVNTAPMGFTWTEDFASAVGSRLDVTATLNDQQRAAVGLDFGEYIQGKSTAVATFTGRSGKFQNAKVDANVTSARLVASQLNWAKPADANATFKADVVFRPDKLIEINNIDAVGQGMKAQGRLVVGGGKIREADFKKLQLGQHNDFVLAYRDTEQDGLSFDVKGKVIDAAGFFKDPSKDEKAKNAPKRPTSIKADMDLAYLQGDVWFTGIKFEYATDGTNITAFKADASADAANLRGQLVTNPDTSRRLTLETADAGRLLRGMTGFRSMIGGALTLKVDLGRMPGPGQTVSSQNAFDGVLKVEKFKIVNQPFIARLLAAGSFTGMDDLMRGEGITFTTMEQVFQGRGDMITISDGTARGPAIGFTSKGTINRSNYHVDFNGTIVPFYGLNSVFDGVPLIGDILTSNEGEGIFGVTYAIDGPLEDMKATVNPLSMLAPGFLRKIFQMGPSPQAAAPMAVPQPKPETKAN